MSVQNINITPNNHFQSIQQSLELNARKLTSKIAISQIDKYISYSELEQKSNQLANLLILQGARAKQPIAICGENSIAIIIGILAILKIGAPYVPISHQYPISRIQYIIEDTDAHLILSDNKNFKLFENCSQEIINIEHDEKFIHLSSQKPLYEVNETDLAYIIYTSGTTGNPKGTLIEHKSLLHLFNSTKKLFNFSVEDNWLLFHSFVFDFSIWEIWGALYNGGTLFIADKRSIINPKQLHKLLLTNKITILNQTPSAFHRLAMNTDISELEKNSSLKTIIFGGEKVTKKILKPWFSQITSNSAIDLVNMYGLTEGTIHVTYHQITEEDFNTNNTSNIGKPFGNIKCHILDDDKNPINTPGTGELYIEGPCLAQGYLNQPELTANVFIKNNTSFVINNRIYKTGDLVKVTENGDMIYMGRRDEQVKINGYRIELTEIENILIDHPCIDNCCVVVVENSYLDKWLCAFFQSGKTVSEEDLLTYLHNYLPNYMIPVEYKQIANTPLNINGKLDKKSLLEKYYSELKTA